MLIILVYHIIWSARLEWLNVVSVVVVTIQKKCRAIVVWQEVLEKTVYKQNSSTPVCRQC